MHPKIQRASGDVIIHASARKGCHIRISKIRPVNWQEITSLLDFLTQESQKEKSETACRFQVTPPQLVYKYL